MRYFTRELLEFVQDLPDGTPQEVAEHRRAARRRWQQAENAYLEYLDEKGPSLHEDVRFLLDLGLHDSIVTRSGATDESVEIVLDTRRAPAMNGETVCLKFVGVLAGRGIYELEGQVWLHDELHAHANSIYEYSAILERSELSVHFRKVQILVE